MNNAIPGLLLIPLLMAGCTSSIEQKEKIARMDNCEKVNSLIDIAAEGFSDLKGVQINTKFLTSWQAKAHLVGDDCQVVQTSTGQHQYICSVQFASFDEASDTHDDALNLVQGCLSESWKESTEKAERRRTTTLTSAQSDARVLLTLGKGYDKKRPWIVSFKVLDM